MGTLMRPFYRSVLGIKLFAAPAENLDGLPSHLDSNRRQCGGKNWLTFGGSHIGLGLILCLFLFTASCKQDTVAPAKPTYRIGYMICNSEEETMARFAPLTEFLAQRLGVNFEPVAIDTLNFSEHVNQLDFTHTNSLLYIAMHRFNGVEPLAVEKKGALGDRSRGLIVSLKKSGIKTLDDLRGKTMLFGPMLAPTSYMSQVYVLQKHGFKIDDDLAFYDFTTGAFKHEKVIYGVLFGKYAAGAFPYYDFEMMLNQGKVELEDFNILAEAPLVPYCNFAVTQRVDERLAKRFKQVLLELTKEDTVEFKGERVRVLERALLDGFAPVIDSDFDLLREMARATNMPPYQKY